MQNLSIKNNKFINIKIKYLKMQKLKLVSLLISFQLFSSILIQDKINSIMEDLQGCMLQEDKTQCTAYQFETKGWQCCSQKVINKHNEEVIKEEEGCTYAINPIQPGKEEMSSDNGKALLKEITRYDFFKMHVGTNVTFQEIK